ncbi:MAG TPA: tripartite tricarboxylate transporter substrate binding protein, partial [Variovorax sp.]|nr:tripartite tricarboxylate transporter substrate binding protein [Variovorax sp.]
GRRKAVSACTLALAGIAAMSGNGAALAQAQDYPSRPLKLVVPFAPGGGADIVARALATPLARRLGQPVIVDNRPGSGGTMGADAVAKAPADGYTLLYTTPGPQFTNPYLMDKLPYDPVKDLVPVTQVAVVPSVLVVNRTVPATNLKELIAYARANPGKLNFASAGIGSSSHLAGELLKYSARIDIVHVPYRGTGAALQDLLGGNVSMAIDSIAVYRAHIESGALRPIAVSTKERSPVLPGVPPIADDLPGFEGSPINYISVRGGTPRAVVERLNREINAVLDAPEVRANLLASGVVPKGGTPEEMAAIVRSESAKWKQVIQVSGARME